MLGTTNGGVKLFLGATLILPSEYCKLNLYKHSYSLKVPHLFAKRNGGINRKENPVPIEMEGKYKIKDIQYEENENDTYGGEQLKEDGTYDKDPEFAKILGSFLSDPSTGQSKLEDRIRNKRHKILHSKTGSSIPMKVTFNSFQFSNSHIWFEFYNAPMEKDIRLLCDAIRSWHIIGRLGGCNSMNMQLSQATFGGRPTYDYIQGANVTPTTFYNIGNLELQDNIGRLYVDIGTTEPLLLDVLVNALTQISNDFCGIKQIVFGGSGFEGWNDSLNDEDEGQEVYKI